MVMALGRRVMRASRLSVFAEPPSTPCRSGFDRVERLIRFGAAADLTVPAAVWADSRVPSHGSGVRRRWR